MFVCFEEKKENENPSVGVILCADKDERVVEYAMSRTMSPTMVSQYTLKLIDKKLLENKLKEITNIIEENNDINNKINALGPSRTNIQVKKIENKEDYI